ncbi:MAG: hypothetical protein P4L22_00500 [Candidatus Babeliales bacterium]|nr:hypothetical protein [Candidatus Babeliales bacterium]
MLKQKFILLLTLLSTSCKPQDQKILNFLHPKTFQHALNANFLNMLKDLFNPDVFIETGTFMGSTTDTAARIFNTVHTIELDPGLYQEASRKFQNRSNISLYQGDSKSVLNNILPDLKSKKILIYLDAHWSGSGTACGDETTPILGELLTIKNCNISNIVIVIDDIRYFQPKAIVDRFKKENNDPTSLGFPSMKKLKKVIAEINPMFKTVLYGDMLIAYEQDENIIVPEILKAFDISRNAKLDNETEEILNAEKTIANATGHEIDALRGLVEIRGPELFCTHYAYWYSLHLLKNKKTQEAYSILNKIAGLGFVNKRTLNILEKHEN